MFPAYAGVSRTHTNPHHTIHRVPRLCGGEPRCQRIDAESSDVFPAYAGVSRKDELIHTAGQCVPRLCGGEPESVDLGAFTLKCSPPMRG